VWDLLFVTLAKLVAAICKPLLEAWARHQAPRLRKRIVEMAAVPIAAAPPGVRVKVAGVVEPLQAAGARAATFFVRDDAGGAVIVQPAQAAAVWRANDEQPFVPAPGDRVAVVGVPRLPDPAVDRELRERTEARLVFAGGEAHPLFIVRLS
jgi:hypothetical protein